MMSSKRMSIFVSIVPLTGFLWLTAQAFGAAQQHQVTYRYIADALAPLPEREDLVSWDAPAVRLNRPFNEADESLLGKALGEAWQVLAIAQSSGDEAILSDRWTGPALERARLSVTDAIDFGGRMSVVTQKAQPTFYHEDGSLFQAEVETLVSRFMTGGEEPDGYGLTRETGIATFLNEATGWKLFAYERKTAEPIAHKPADWRGTANGINYYPGATPWHDFWPEFDADIVAADFEQIKKLNANAVRVFLPRKPFLSQSTHATALGDLQTLLQLAQEYDLQVIPTLFDLRTGYQASEWALDALYLQRVLPVIAESDNVAFIDLKNEPDLDFETHGQAQVLAWLRTMLGIMRQEAPGFATTVGWSASDHAHLLADKIDVVTYHDYAPVSTSRQRLNDVMANVGNKPVVITEIGTSTYDLALGFPGTESEQAEHLAERIEALKDASGVLIWTLHDFPDVDPRVIGKSPWVQRLQSSFGLIRTDGSEKPAASIIRETFDEPDN